ncbi:GIY-YIG nuclease family protein [Paenibacillus ferrarius]|uniref:GIY-YIG nuclease family protein n=1 Tax=Paenibacillus ferrarius TaxID=1469647 RepID=UPI003D2B4B98
MLDKNKKKELSSAYAQTFRAMGVYQIRNTSNGKIYVVSSMDLEGARNRFDFGKQMNMSIFHELQKDWQAFGPNCFVFEELDRLKPDDDAPVDATSQKHYRDEVDALLELWLEKLQPYEEKGYNRRKR